MWDSLGSVSVSASASASVSSLHFCMFSSPASSPPLLFSLTSFPPHLWCGALSSRTLRSAIPTCSHWWATFASWFTQGLMAYKMGQEQNKVGYKVLGVALVILSAFQFSLGLFLTIAGQCEWDSTQLTALTSTPLRAHDVRRF